jgi:hypothetical protein
MRHIDTRIQLYIKTKLNSMWVIRLVNDTIANYAPTYTVPRGKFGSNYSKK